MIPISKCVLLLIDGTRESLKPLEFLRRLYPDLKHIKMMVFYFLPPLAPIYREKPDSPEMVRKRTEILKAREKETRTVLTQAREALLKVGFPEEAILEHVQEKASSTSKDACLVAGVKKVDALVMQKQTCTSLEDLLKEDPTLALLQHCVGCPVWLMEGDIDPSKAAICVLNEDTSLRAADHAAFMLAETKADVILLHASRGVTTPQTGPAVNPGPKIETWLKTDAGKAMERYLIEARELVSREGIPDERIHLSIIPSRGNVAAEIMEYCKSQRIGIVVIGHSNPSGKWSFLKSSVTKKALADFKDMAVWVNQ